MLFPNLESLTINDCFELTELPFLHCVYPPEQDGNMHWLPKVRTLQIDQCPKLSSLPSIPWTPALKSVFISSLGSGLEYLYLNDNHLRIGGNQNLCSLDEKVLALHNLTGINRLDIQSCPSLTAPSEGPNDTRYKLPVESLTIRSCSFSGKEATYMFSHLPNISLLQIIDCPGIQQLGVVEAEEPQHRAWSSSSAAQENELEGLLLLPSSATLTRLYIDQGGDELKSEGILPIITQGHLRILSVWSAPKFFMGWDTMLQGLQDEQDHQLLLRHSSKLHRLRTDDVIGVLAGPICSFFSMSLTVLCFWRNNELEHFTEEQEKALQLLTSLEELEFRSCPKLQCLPSSLHELPALRRLQIWNCPAIRLLPKDGLPRSLQKLDVHSCGNDDLKQQFRDLLGMTDLNIKL